jgi:UDP-N-acetylglucosamine acyltransferase
MKIEKIAATKKNNSVTKSASIIDHRAIIDSSAKIDADVVVGPWSYIGPNVEIGSGTVIGSHVVIQQNTKIGKNNQIFSFGSLGGDPQDINYKGEETFLEIGDENVIREFATLNRGSTRGTRVTKIGNNNSIFAYSHVAHDCVIGNEVLLVNHTTLAGHVIIDDYATIGAFCAVHQFCRIGSYSFLTRGAMVPKDILPYMMVVGICEPPCGLNTEGLKRRGFSNSTISALKKAYKIFFRSGLKLPEVREELVKMAVEIPEINLMIEFMDNSQRGFTR